MSSTVASVNDLLDEDEGGLSGFTILAILATLLMVFCLVVYYAYRQGKASAITASEQLPVVAADPRPVAEDVPLTAEADPSRQEVYDRVSGAVPTRIVTAENPGQDALDGYSGAPTKLSRNQEPLSARKPADDPVVTAMTEPAEDTVSPPSRKPETQPAAARTKPEPARTAEAKPAETASSRNAAGALAGTHVVQVGAFDSNAAALDFFDKMAGRMGSMVSAKKPDIQVATVNGRTYHRLRIGPFSSKSDANSYCSQLKSKGQDCLVRGV